MSSETVSLLPCPFCGSEARAIGEFRRDPFTNTIRGVECSACPAAIVFYPDNDPYASQEEFEAKISETVAAWNLRSKPVASGVEVKPLEWGLVEGRREDMPKWRAVDATGLPYEIFKAWWGRENEWGFVALGTFWHTESDAKAAAEADYRRHILSALLPKATAPVVSKPVVGSDDLEARIFNTLVHDYPAPYTKVDALAKKLARLYAAPQPQPKAVTEEMVERAWFDAQTWPTPISRSMVRRALEAAMKEA